MRLSLLFEVYPGEADARDTAEVVGQGGAHVEKLLHPYGTGHPHMQDVFRIEVEDLGVVGQRGATGDAPSRSESVFTG
jgi:hypothetical protein